jgi:hypothetical protein
VDRENRLAFRGPPGPALVAQDGGDPVVNGGAYEALERAAADAEERADLGCWQLASHRQKDGAAQLR